MKDDIKRARGVAREEGITPEKLCAFLDYLHRCKQSGGYDLDSKGNLTVESIRDIARAFLEGDR